tara:strand:+ start:3049 stop:3222 length:174 start_codon:yes stop_codon:yes gene_type:complete
MTEYQLSVLKTISGDDQQLSCGKALDKAIKWLYDGEYIQGQSYKYASEKGKQYLGEL